MLEAALLCVSLNVWHEARGEEYEGQVAVAEVTERRVQDSRWPSSHCSVVYQPWQFEWTAKYGTVSDTPAPSPSSASWQRAIQASKEGMQNVRDGTTVTSCSDHFYNPDAASPAWEDSDSTWHDMTIGGHRFLCSAW